MIKDHKWSHVVVNIFYFKHIILCIVTSNLSVVFICTILDVSIFHPAVNCQHFSHEGLLVFGHVVLVFCQF